MTKTFCTACGARADSTWAFAMCCGAKMAEPIKVSDSEEEETQAPAQGGKKVGQKVPAKRQKGPDGKPVTTVTKKSLTRAIH